MSKRSEDEEDKTWFRSERYFCEGGKWFLATREGEILGPCDSKADAEQELMLYIRKLEERSKFGL